MLKPCDEQLWLDAHYLWVRGLSADLCSWYYRNICKHKLSFFLFPIAFFHDAFSTLLMDWSEPEICRIRLSPFFFNIHLNVFTKLSFQTDLIWRKCRGPPHDQLASCAWLTVPFAVHCRRTNHRFLLYSLYASTVGNHYTVGIRTQSSEIVY